MSKLWAQTFHFLCNSWIIVNHDLVVKEFLKLLDKFVEYSVLNGFYFIKIRKETSSWDSVFLYEYSVILKTESQIITRKKKTLNALRKSRTHCLRKSTDKSWFAPYDLLWYHGGLVLTSKNCGILFLHDDSKIYYSNQNRTFSMSIGL